MPWRCPACVTEIRHGSLELQPRSGDRYRCHICRLELEFDAATNSLRIAPLEADHQTKPLFLDDRPRVLPSPLSKPKPRPK